jgi:hypothetical protein
MAVSEPFRPWWFSVAAPTGRAANGGPMALTSRLPAASSRAPLPPLVPRVLFSKSWVSSKMAVQFRARMSLGSSEAN